MNNSSSQVDLYPSLDEPSYVSRSNMSPQAGMNQEYLAKNDQQYDSIYENRHSLRNPSNALPMLAASQTSPGMPSHQYFGHSAVPLRSTSSMYLTGTGLSSASSRVDPPQAAAPRSNVPYYETQHLSSSYPSERGETGRHISGDHPIQHVQYGSHIPASSPHPQIRQMELDIDSGRGMDLSVLSSEQYNDGASYQALRESQSIDSQPGQGGRGERRKRTSEGAGIDVGAMETPTKSRRGNAAESTKPRGRPRLDTRDETAADVC